MMHMPSAAALRAPAMQALPLGPLPDADELRGLAADRLEFRHLRSARDIDAVRPLREFINLSHAQADPHYQELEKKETNWA